MLPALDRLNLPIPLGGTSNHFRTSALVWLMAWDPFNVTEDADLGLRLARKGYRCQVLNSTTYEEAPARLDGLVSPAHALAQRLCADLAGAYAQPARIVARAWAERLPGLSDHGRRHHHWRRSCIPGSMCWPASNLPTAACWRGREACSAGRSGSLPGSICRWAISRPWGSDLLAVRRRGYHALLKQIPLMPFYWLLISAAAYRALWQFMTARFEWEKTEHGLSRSMTRRANEEKAAADPKGEFGAGEGNRTPDT